jgi:hypothetical protein
MLLRFAGERNQGINISFPVFIPLTPIETNSNLKAFRTSTELMPKDGSLSSGGTGPQQKKRQQEEHLDAPLKMQRTPCSVMRRGGVKCIMYLFADVHPYPYPYAMVGIAAVMHPGA